MTDLSLTCRRTMKASPEQIYNAWLDPAMIARYMTLGPDMVARDTGSDPVIGGRFHFTMVGENAHLHEGTYLDLIPHSRILFSWQSPWSAPGSQVELRLTPTDEGTEVVLTHRKFLSEDSRDGHARVWATILERVETLAA